MLARSMVQFLDLLPFIFRVIKQICKLCDPDFLLGDALELPVGGLGVGIAPIQPLAPEHAILAGEPLIV